MAATPATVFTDQMTSLTGNLNGVVQALPQVNLVGGKERIFISSLTLAAQASGVVVGVARIPLFAAIIGITAITSVSLGTSTIAFGDAGNGNSAIYGAAAVLTATDTPTIWAKTTTYGVPVTSGFDSVSGLAVTYASSSGFGSLYEDVTMTIGVAALPGAGTLRILTRYVID